MEIKDEVTKEIRLEKESNKEVITSPDPEEEENNNQKGQRSRRAHTRYYGRAYPVQYFKPKVGSSSGGVLVDINKGDTTQKQKSPLAKNVVQHDTRTPHEVEQNKVKTQNTFEALTKIDDQETVDTITKMDKEGKLNEAVVSNTREKSVESVIKNDSECQKDNNDNTEEVDIVGQGQHHQVSSEKIVAYTKTWVESSFNTPQKSDVGAMDLVDEKVIASKASWGNMVDEVFKDTGGTIKEEVIIAQEETELMLVNDSPRIKTHAKNSKSNAVVICENISPFNGSIPKKVSPNKRLHDLVSHIILHIEEDKDENSIDNGLEYNKGEEDKSENVLQNMENIYNQDGVSPKATSNGHKKSGRQANGEKQQPTRVLPKRSAAK
ncbi:hypothetical protein K7X08_035700 [Anisodus acutangulus]|uniref:Uncharacterized protein n=1 Tax=Anisodus acutangulus TaxID=402998 RepID=A0A9Q1LVK0_9SOLA|nr:hypothetical protein K7X08_035700 [Anisodus acutangulus]